MRVLILQRFDLSSVSCARRVLCQTEELLKRGHEVILTDFPHPQRQQEVPSIVNISHLGGTVVPLERKITSLPANYKKLQKITPRPDIVHLWKSYPDVSLPAIQLSRKWRIPLHYDWDDWENGIAQELTGSGMAGWAAGRWDRILPGCSDTISTASAFLREKTLALGIEEQQIFDAPVGADIEKFHPRKKNQALYQKLGLREPVLVYSGQLEVATYVGQAIRVFALLRREFQTAKLLVLGGGRKLNEFKKIAEEEKVSRHVIFTDYVPADEVPDYLALADVALAPFLRNDVTRAKSPLKIAEYLAMGLPVVSSEVGEAPKMTLGAGVCVPCGKIKAMAEQTAWILRNPGVRESMAKAGRKRAEEKYNWSNHVDSLLSAYHYAIENMEK